MRPYCPGICPRISNSIAHRIAKFIWNNHWYYSWKDWNIAPDKAEITPRKITWMTSRMTYIARKKIANMMGFSLRLILDTPIVDPNSRCINEAIRGHNVTLFRIKYSYLCGHKWPFTPAAGLYFVVVGGRSWLFLFDKTFDYNASKACF